MNTIGSSSVSKKFITLSLGFRKQNLHALYDLLLFFGVGTGLVVFLDWFFLHFPKGEPSLTLMISVNTLVALSFFLFATALMRNRGLSWKDMGIRAPESFLRTVFWGILLCLVAFLLFITLEAMESYFLSDFDRLEKLNETHDKRPSVSDHLGGGSPLWFIVYMLGPYAWIHVALFEEMIMRGFVFHRFEKLFDWLPSGVAVPLVIILQGIIFGAIHIRGQGFEGFIVVSCLGIIVGAVFVASGRNLWAVVLGHGLGTMLPMINDVVYR